MSSSTRSSAVKNKPYTPASMLNLRIETTQEKERRRKELERSGICLKCEHIQTHKVSLGGVLRQPLTNANVQNGRCLVCYPLLNGRRGSLAAFCMPLGLANEEELRTSMSTTGVEPQEGDATTNDQDDNVSAPAAVPIAVMSQPLLPQDNHMIHQANITRDDSSSPLVQEERGDDEVYLNNAYTTLPNRLSTDSSGWEEPNANQDTSTSANIDGFHNRTDGDNQAQRLYHRPSRFSTMSDSSGWEVETATFASSRNSNSDASRSFTVEDRSSGGELYQRRYPPSFGSNQDFSSPYVFSNEYSDMDYSRHQDDLLGIPNPAEEEKEEYYDNAALLPNSRPAEIAVESQFMNVTAGAVDVLQSMLSMLENVNFVEEGMHWLINHSKTHEGVVEILKCELSIALCLDCIDKHRLNTNVIFPALKLLNRLILFNIEEMDYSKRKCHYSHDRKMKIDTVTHILDYEGLKLCKVMIATHVHNAELMKLVCELLWAFCIEGGEGDSRVARLFVEEGLVSSMKYLLEEQVDFNVLGNVGEILYFVIQYSDRGRRQLAENGGEDALRNVMRNVEFIGGAGGGSNLQSSLSKVLMLLL
eukprot:CAMPEP_0196808654 /NCGR_PEP_ID=MMETSP1362-20130617/8644_1 /TAXON_ID=163516 /ORGANISM="Leptocylindrus danicus, Strain CCMP1856" /LENGTH=587 /DNA_ID=CAMNT_0042183069 /DNA_START=7 /DNA_END=1770 /DNA_ORIENTATION=+